MTYTFDDWRGGAPLPDGFDCADAIDGGWSKDQIDAFMRALARPWSPPVTHEKKTVVEPAQSETAHDPNYPDYIPASMTDEDFERKPWCDHPLLEWAFLTYDGIFYNLKTGDKMSKTAFDLAMERITPAVEVVDPNKGPQAKRFPASKVLLSRMNGVIASNYMYRPDAADFHIFSFEGVQYVNSYRPETVPEIDPNWQDHWAWRTCQDHILNLIPDGGQTIIQWMAHNVRHPGTKINWAPVIVGPQGAGKTVMGDILKAAMGRAHVGIASVEEIMSDYTDWGEGVSVRVLEEIRIPGEKRTTVMNRLKPFITNRQTRIYPKGLKGKEILNVTNYIAFTNYRDALALDEDDRRWPVWHTRYQTREELLADLGSDHFIRLYEAIDNHPGVIRGWLMNVDLAGFDRFNPPAMTEAKRQMIELARAPLDSDMREAMALGGEGIGPDVIATDCLREKMREIGGRSVNTSTLSSMLTECGYVKYDSVIKWRDKTRRVYYRAGAVPSGLAGPMMVQWLRDRLDATVNTQSSREPLPDGMENW